ncbi:MAG: outer membrane beta-barrel protein [Bacteroidales bacterium]|nr:outer membrane beta-barrel protein [Bacteroidales bacterium]
MKKLLSLFVLLLASGIAARAQVVILNDNVLRGRMSEIKTTVVDSLTNEPVSYASVYVIPSKDTTITNFTLSGPNGEARLDEVPFGSYVFHVEMMGYKPYLKERYFREERVDMGTIRLQVDEEFLRAAVVTDVGNPIVVKQDTVEFNASSFRVGANAMLKDLLQRMPGMEITEDGKVKFNGQAIDKLTVGGRTFFFDDQSTALNNLPASVVDKIRVIDRESEQTRASGIQDGNREKVLDVALKKEYEQGWFGNVGLKGGTTLGEKDGDDVLRDERGLLYNGNALVSAYTEKDQVTFIANGQNINDSNAYIIVVSDAGERRTNSNQGLSTAAQLAVNANTSRIKDVETTVTVNYKFSDTVYGSRADRTTYQDVGNLSSTSEDSGKTIANGLSANMEFEKETGKVWFHIRPDFRYNTSDYKDGSSSETFQEGIFVNSSVNKAVGSSERKAADLIADMSFREIGGKKDRNIMVVLESFYNGSDGESVESSVLTTSAGDDSRTMTYKSNGLSYGMEGSIQYTEPIGDKLTLSSLVQYGWSGDNNVKDAFDASGKNDYYSSETRINYLEQQYNLIAQYKLGQSTWLTLGGRATGILNETFSKSYGISETTGKDEWSWFFTPTLRFQHVKGNDRINVSATGYGRQPSNSQMLPVLNIANPSRLGIGNIYLKPYSMTSFNASWSRNNRQKFSTLMVYLYGQLNNNPIGSALWYDADGIMYSIPVNAPKPSLSGNLMLNYTTPLDAKKNWFLTLNGMASYSSALSYQARTTLPGLDKDTFDYSAFMADFWGNAAGDRFYGGLSGFGESRTRSVTIPVGFTVKYNQDHYSLSAGANTQGRIARYSLNPNADLNTLDTRFMADATYTTKHEFEFHTDLAYVFYNGYAEGYGQPEWQWNAEVSKNVGAFNLSVKVHDILNQTRNLTHTVTANYEEDSYRLIMGRYVLFGVKWNFGKMNAAHSQRAQQAARSVLF